MTIVNVNSSAIESVGFNPETGDLQVTFIQRSGNRATYTYPDHTQATFDAFVAAPSAGRFFHANIRPR